MKILIALLAVFAINQGISQNIPDGWKTADSKYISLAVPSDFKVMQYGETKIVMNGWESEQGDKDRFKENFGVIIKDLSSDPMTLSEFAEATRKEYESDDNSTSIEKFEKIDSPAGEAYEFEYLMEMNGVEFYHYLRLYIKNDLGYSILFTTEKKSKSKYEKMIQSIFNSIELKN